MAKKAPPSYKNIVGLSFAQGILVMLNLIAFASFFFVQVGSIFFLVPAFIIDALYVVNHERVGPRMDAIEPSRLIMKTVLLVLLSCLIIFSTLFLFQLFRTD